MCRQNGVPGRRYVQAHSSWEVLRYFRRLPKYFLTVDLRDKSSNKLVEALGCWRSIAASAMRYFTRSQLTSTLIADIQAHFNLGNILPLPNQCEGPKTTPSAQTTNLSKTHPSSANDTYPSSSPGDRCVDTSREYRQMNVFAVKESREHQRQRGRRDMSQN